MCGEKARRPRRGQAILGSPPRVRGKVGGVRCGGSAAGITPACAGKRWLEGKARRAEGDHPRVCGEKSRFQKPKATPPGSPPRVRGKVGAGQPTCNGRGITPACAGKSRSPKSKVFSIWDHPRVCGEKTVSPRKFLLTLGSPPRVRGKVFNSQPNRPESGITPACAGKSTSTHDWFNGWRDHPRVCGEKILDSIPNLVAARITPACAGKRWAKYTQSPEI